MGQRESCTEHELQQEDEGEEDTVSNLSERRFPLCCVTADAPGDTCVGLLRDDSLSGGAACSCSPRSDTHGSSGVPRELNVLGMLKPWQSPYKPSSGSEAGSRSSASSGKERTHSSTSLRSLVRSFATDVVSGLIVVLIHPKTVTKMQFLLQMDKYLTVFSLRGKTGSLLEPSAQDFNIRDVTSIYKGSGVSQRVPALAGISTHCVGLDAARPDKSIFFYFDDPADGNNFYACFKILRMSLEMVPRQNH